ncbi:MAG: lysylphosphatidylglycerol synthase domain-containing protein [Chitinophagaceae bacterium]
MKWTIGILVMALLCWHLYRQIDLQLKSGAVFNWWPTDTVLYFVAAVLLLPINISIESRKWQWLLSSIRKTSFVQALPSVLCGIAASVITPNRIGEYPGRLLALRERRSTRLISVSILGACSQLVSIMLAGCCGLLFYIPNHPASYNIAVLILTIIVSIFLLLFYLSFEKWSGYIERFSWLQRLRLWARFLHRFSLREQIIILLASLARMLVFFCQFWLLLRWQGVSMGFAEGMLLCALFFWAMAVIPSIALAELGIRGTVAVFLFSAYTNNIAGIALAVFVIWLLNLMLPAFLGAFLFFKTKVPKILAKGKAVSV